MTPDPADHTQRFSGRAAEYAQARPGYPEGVITNLQRAGALPPGAAVADIGSGTGISSRLFAEAGCRVFAVEPNPAMHAEAARAGHEGITIIDGSAEATTLADASVDLVAAAQALHWFDAGRAAAEFARILRPGGWITVFWNTRDQGATPFMLELEELIRRFGTDYERVHHEKLPQATLETVMPRERRHLELPNRQVLDRAGLRARLLSASYLPRAGTAEADAMLNEADELFDRHAEGDVVTIIYRVDQYLGRPAA